MTRVDTRMTRLIALSACLLAAACLVEARPDLSHLQDLIESEESSPRFLDSNSSSVSVSLSSLVVGVVALVMLALLASLVSYFIFGESVPEFSGYSGYSSSHSGGGYGSGRSSDASSPYSHLFENLSVLDWISLAEEVYRDFDGASMDCQKRVICQLHQNEADWGTTARRMNTAFSYLQYLELLNLPEDVRAMVDEYINAAEQGRIGTQTCSSVFPRCNFDAVQMIAKYSNRQN